MPFYCTMGRLALPFWISILMVGISIYIRMRMQESPLYVELKATGKTSLNPIKESFSHKANLKWCYWPCLVRWWDKELCGTQASFMHRIFETKCNIEFEQSQTIILWAIVFATPFLYLLGWLSDKIGRKWIMMAGDCTGSVYVQAAIWYISERFKLQTWISSSYSDFFNDKESLIKTDTIINGSLRE